MKCPKCGVEAKVTHERKEGRSRPFTDLDGTTQFPSIDDILADREVHFFGHGFDKVYECPTHGEFGVKGEHVEFADPDTWVEGPNGEKLFRL